MSPDAEEASRIRGRGNIYRRLRIAAEKAA